MTDSSYAVYTNAFGETTFSSSSSDDPVVSLLKSGQIVKRAIFDDADVEHFKNSPSSGKLIQFIQLCADHIVGKEIHGTNYLISSQTMIIDEFMKSLLVVIDETPAIHQPMRFGNKAFRSFHQKLTLLTPDFIRKLLSSSSTSSSCEISNEVIAELTVYIISSFGNEVRIDYGTGHELNMAVFFYCLYHLHIINDEMISALILRCFTSYIHVMRKLQTIYMLEPAGSHGVWGLDDYHCLTFLWGAAQLCGHMELTPASIHDMDVLREYKDDYLYMEGIYFIRTIKSSAPFAETSPMLNDISAVGDWQRVTQGMMRLFTAEVLYKRPVVQHLPFGSILSCTWSSSSSSSSDAHMTGQDSNSIISSAYSRMPSGGMMPIHHNTGAHRPRPIASHPPVKLQAADNNNNTKIA